MYLIFDFYVEYLELDLSLKIMVEADMSVASSKLPYTHTVNCNVTRDDFKTSKKFKYKHVSPMEAYEISS